MSTKTTPSERNPVGRVGHQPDPDDILTPEEAVLLHTAEQQIRHGESVTLAELEHELDRKPRPRSRKTA
jgi:hypothetical protein